MRENGVAKLALCTLEFAHKTGQCFHRLESYGVVERDAHTADGTVSDGAGEAGACGSHGELFFDGFVSASYAKHDVHFRTRGFFYGASVERAAIEDIVKEFGFGVVELGDAGDTAHGFDPLENQADDVNRKGWRGVVKRLLFYLGAVLQQRGQIFVGSFREIFTDDDQCGSRGSKVFLRAGKDHAEFADVDGVRSDIGRHVRHDRGGGLGNGGILRAFD